MGSTDRRDSSLDEALKAAFESETGESVLARIERVSGRTSRILLHDPPSELSPPLKVPAPGQEAEAKDDSRYQIVGEIARGGVGVVYKGRDKNLGRDVALKVLRTEHVTRAEVFDRFIEEAQIGAQLQHPGIVPVYGLGLQPDGQPYFTMKLIKGRTLSGLLKEREDPGENRRRFLAIFEQACQTLAYAHARGVIHRDLKPSNIMVGSFGEVQVVDWGFGKVLGRPDHSAQRLHERTVIATVRSESEGSHSIAGSVMGTPAYMPPEQALGHIDELDEQSDVFSLGAILCEILTGEPPYTGPSKDLLVLAAQASLGEAHERLDGCGADEDLVELTKRCLAPRRSKRPENGGELGRAIADHLAAAEERAHKAELRAVRERSRFDREREQAVWEKRAKKKMRILAAALLAAVLLGGGAYFVHDAGQRARIAEARPKVEAAMEDATHLGAQGKWTEALAVALKAVALAADADAETRARAEDLQRRTTEAERAADAAAERAETNRRFVARLEEIRLQRGEDFDDAATDTAYATVFADHGVGPVEEKPGEAGALIRDRFPEIAIDLAAALDDWAWLRRSRLPRKDWQRLVEIARHADPDEWRNGLRDALTKKDLERLRALAAEAIERDLSVRSLSRLGASLFASGDPEAARAFLGAVQRKHPDDLWVNCYLAWSASLCKPPRWEEAVRFHTAGLAVRPRSWLMWFNLGYAHLAKRDFDEAIEANRVALRLKPDWVPPRINLATALLKRGRPDEALAVSRKAVELDPDCAAAHTNIGNAYRDKGLLAESIEPYRRAVRLRPDKALYIVNVGLALGELGRLEESLEALRKGLRLDPSNALAYQGLGATLHAMGHLNESIEASRKAIRLMPDLAGAHHTLGNALDAQGKHDEAIAAYREAIRLDPCHAKAHSGLGNALLAKGLIDEAIAAHRKAVGAKPDLAAAHTHLGNALWRKGRRDEAISAYREALRLAPHNPTVVRNLVGALCLKGLTAEAIDVCREGVRRNPKHAVLRFVLGNSLMSSGRIDEAIAEFRKGLRLAPDHAGAHINLGNTLGRKGLWDEAIATYRDGVRRNPEHADLYLCLAGALSKRGLHDQAIEAYRHAIRLKPGDAAAHYNLGTVLLKKNDLDGAIASFREAIRHDPDLAEAHYNLGHALLLQGRFRESLAARRRGHELGSRRPDWRYPSLQWVRRTERFVELEKRLSGVLAGDDRPADAREQLAFAETCYLTKRHAAAARFYREALKDGPPLVADRYRFAAACAAALAGSGKGMDARELDDATRAGWRQQALAWLRAELAKGRPVMTLKSWQRDPDLAGVRDDEGLEKLPAREQQQWRAFWKEVAALAAKEGK